MKWTLKLVAEVVPGIPTEHEVATIERIEEFSPATVGLTIGEGKAILAGLQQQMVTAQVQHHGVSIHRCQGCGRAFRTKGYYHSTLRSVYGNVGMRIRRLRGCSCAGLQQSSFSTVFTNQDPTTPELRYLTAKLAALLPFGRVADFLGELLPLSAQITPNTVRNRTIKVGKRLKRSAEALAIPMRKTPCEEVIVGMDGGYVRSRHPRPERNFEVIAGKVLDDEGIATRFAFVRSGGSAALSSASLALRRCGANDSTLVTVLTDGDAGLRTIHRELAPQAEHVLDWFHVSMKFQNLKQLAKGINATADGAVRAHALAQLERAKWRFWNGYTKRGIAGLVHLEHWSWAQCFQHILPLRKMAGALLNLIRYLESNSDSMPNYGSRYRDRLRISTGFVESAVNEIIAKRMAKKQQMRWNRHTIQPFLDVRVHVLNATLEDAFRHWHRGFRPFADLLQPAAAA
jgi:hypothetical protein